jgi:predicted AAA+ superfamily ATPase
VGKTSLLRATYPHALWIDLLKADEFRRYVEHPEYLRTEDTAGATDARIVIDEVQKVPALLDEVHWLIENRGLSFALCGSSARRVRRGHANLLGGRAVRCELFGLSCAELGADPDLLRLLNHGYLPRHYLAERPRPMLEAYVGDYLKEEIAAEGLVRNLPAFSTFLSVAALSDADLVNFASIARDCGVSAPTVRGYFEILEDTLLGRWLPSYRERPKRRVIQAPKFFFTDVGVVNFLLRRGQLAPGTELFGKAFENWVFHELCAYNAYSGTGAPLSYWRLPSGIEVDFVVGQMEVAIEAKGTEQVRADAGRSLEELKRDQGRVGKRLIVSLEPRLRRLENGIEVLPWRRFVEDLWAGKLF